MLLPIYQKKFEKDIEKRKKTSTHIIFARTGSHSDLF
jgi:mRNA-degrading endonuclease YafQ of YafQ-DinJ toxin-antitoxin module